MKFVQNGVQVKFLELVQFFLVAFFFVVHRVLQMGHPRR